MNQIYEEEDEAKTCVTGAVTGIFNEVIISKAILVPKFIILLDNFNLFITFLGLLYKSSSGVKSCAKGGIFGLTAAALWAFLLKKDQRISDYM